MNLSSVFRPCITRKPLSNFLTLSLWRCGGSGKKSPIGFKCEPIGFSVSSQALPKVVRGNISRSTYSPTRCFHLPLCYEATLLLPPCTVSLKNWIGVAIQGSYPYATTSLSARSRSLLSGGTLQARTVVMLLLGNYTFSVATTRITYSFPSPSV